MAPAVAEADFGDGAAAVAAGGLGDGADGDDGVDAGFVGETEDGADFGLAALPAGGDETAEADGLDGEEEVLDGGVDGGAVGVAGLGAGDDEDGNVAPGGAEVVGAGVVAKQGSAQLIEDLAEPVP